IIAEDYTFENVRICAQSSAEYFLEHGGAEKGVVVGYDTRFASEDFAAAAAEVLAANGIPVIMTSHAVPTPVTSFTVQSNGAAGAVMITASHNPGGYNGLKLKDHRAGSAPPEMISDIERRIADVQAAGRMKRITLAEAKAKSLYRTVDPDEGFLEQMRRMLGQDRIDAIKNAGITVMVDSMYGAGSGYTARLLEGGKTKIVELHRERNPVLQVMTLLALYMLESKGEVGGLVKTITTSSMLYKLGELFHVEVAETDVGFKYVGPKMEEINAVMGGEESGGYAFRGHIPERDGILAGLYFLDFVVQSGKTPAQLVEYLYSKVGPHYYDRIDLTFPMADRAAIIRRVADARPEGLDGSPVAAVDSYQDDAGALTGMRFRLQDGSWLLIRFSGTEPVLRVYSETTSPARAQTMLQAGKAMAGL
ncbi:MAG: phosphoglucomutase/phosphomannomutase family protein, partial [Chloroflexi bacterium]|nr:phosphoglucomutase/phosphomannomutase family protein [Chloroflexota bacterium]